MVEHPIRYLYSYRLDLLSARRQVHLCRVRSAFVCVMCAGSGTMFVEGGQVRTVEETAVGVRFDRPRLDSPSPIHQILVWATK
jgi:hypothetical protein